MSIPVWSHCPVLLFMAYHHLFISLRFVSGLYFLFQPASSKKAGVFSLQGWPQNYVWCRMDTEICPEKKSNWTNKKKVSLFLGLRAHTKPWFLRGTISFPSWFSHTKKNFFPNTLLLLPPKGKSVTLVKVLASLSLFWVEIIYQNSREKTCPFFLLLSVAEPVGACAGGFSFALSSSYHTEALHLLTHVLFISWFVNPAGNRVVFI